MKYYCVVKLHNKKNLATNFYFSRTVPVSGKIVSKFVFWSKSNRATISLPRLEFLRKIHLISHLCVSVVSVSFACCRLPANHPLIAFNVWQICDGRDFQHKCSFGELNFLLPQNCLRSTKPRLLQMCCYAFVYFYQGPFCVILINLSFS